jgi:hypothetical protein
MTIRDLIVALRRHPVVVLVVVALTGATAWRIDTAAPVYRSEVTVALVNQDANGNSYSSFSANLLVVAHITGEQMNDGTTRDRVVAAGGARDYRVSMINRGNDEVPLYDQPYLDVYYDSPSPARATATIRATLSVLGATLRERQLTAGASGQALVGFRTVSGDEQPTLISPGPKRSLAAVLLIGLILMIFITRVADRRPTIDLTRWRRRTARRRRVHERTAGA